MASNLPLGKPALRADDLLPDRPVGLASTAMCDDPTPARPASPASPTTSIVTTRLATRKASSTVTFTLRLMEPFEMAR